MLFPAVDQAVVEGAGGDDSGAGADGAAVAKADALDGSLALAVVVGRWLLVVGKGRFLVAALLGMTRLWGFSANCSTAHPRLHPTVATRKDDGFSF